MAALSATMVSAPCSSPGWWMGHSHPLIVPSLLSICEPVTKDAAQLRRTVWADVPGEPRLNSGGRSITVHDHTLILEESTPISEAWSGIMPNLVRCHFCIAQRESLPLGSGYSETSGDLVPKTLGRNIRHDRPILLLVEPTSKS